MRQATLQRSEPFATLRAVSFAAEGTSQSKKTKIMHSNYLSRGYRSLTKVGGALFLYGHSLAEKDEHILRLIQRGRSKHVFVSIYGDPKDPLNTALTERAMLLQGGSQKRKVELYDASSARVWG